MVIAQESKVGTQVAIELSNVFFPIQEVSEVLAIKAKELIVRDMDDVDTMKKARELRLELKKIRCDVENKRKVLKEESVRRNKAIDGVANIIKFLIIPAEEHLEEQEKFIENKIKEARDKKIRERTDKIIDLDGDSAIYNLGDMSEDSFGDLLDSLTYQREKKKQEAVKLEADRIAQEKKDRVEQERIKKENEKLRKENAKKDEVLKKQKAKILADQKANEAKDKEAKDKFLAELKKKDDAKKAERKAKLAPDKDKLVSLSNAVGTISFPVLRSEEAQAVLREVAKRLNAVALYITEKSIEL